MNKREERQNQLVKILRKRNKIGFEELSEMLDVSVMTIRRDIAMLKENNIVLDVPGMAVLNNEFETQQDTYLLSSAGCVNIKEKDSIGKYAASLLKEDDCIIIDNGSTVEYLVDNIPKDIRITIFTCNLNVLHKIYKYSNIAIIFGGGYFHSDTMLFECEETLQLINRLRATKVFISAAGIHEKMGLTCMNSYEVKVKKALIHAGAEKILLADSSKFDVVKPNYLEDWKVLDRIITDQSISAQWADLISSEDIILDIV